MSDQSATNPMEPVDGYGRMSAIKTWVSLEFDITESELIGGQRSRRISRARQAAYWLAKKSTRLSLPQIGAALGKDHTSVMYGVGRATEIMAVDAQFNETVTRLFRRLST